MQYSQFHIAISITGLKTIKWWRYR